MTLQKVKSNKLEKKVNVCLIVVIFLLLGISVFAPVVKLFAIDYEGADEAFEKGGAVPSDPSDYDSAAGASDYTAISSSDNTRWETSQAVAADWDSQIYTFVINENIGDITNLTLEWEGYGETDSSFLSYFYIWNINSGSWEELDDADFTSESDLTLTGGIVSNISHYIDSGSKKLIIMTTSQKSGSSNGDPCTVPGECLSGFCVDGYCCDGPCSGDCEACNLSGAEGTCTIRNADDNVECGTCERCDGTNNNCQYTDSGEEGKNCTAVCYECNGSGSCVTVADYQADDKGPNQCDANAPHCSGNTFYEGYVCVSGTCSNNNDIGCCQGSYCAVDRYCSLTHACTLTPLCQTKVDNGFGTAWASEGSQPSGCDGVCQACAGGACGNALKDTDPGSDCGTGNCGTGNCNGVGGCLGYDTGDRNCPRCYTCADFDVGCEAYPNYTQDTTGPNRCNNACSACKNGICSSGGSDLDTTWGSGLYGCSESNQRCFGAICRTCDFGYGSTLNSAGGYLYDDGCSGCAGQGGKVCWYIGYYPSYDENTCAYHCQDHGSTCVVANWNDNNSCTVTTWLVNQVFHPGVTGGIPSEYYNCCSPDWGCTVPSWECINSTDDGQICQEIWGAGGHNYAGAPLYDNTNCLINSKQGPCVCIKRNPAVAQDCNAQADYIDDTTMVKRVCACTF